MHTNMLLDVIRAPELTQSVYGNSTGSISCMQQLLLESYFMF